MSFSQDGDGSRRNNNSLLFESAREFRVTSEDLDAEDAEGAVLEAIEKRNEAGSTPSSLVGSTVSGSGHERDASETKLYRAISSFSQNSQQSKSKHPTHSTSTGVSSSGTSPIKRFKEAAERVRRMNMLKNALNTSTKRHHRRVSSARNLLLGIQEDEETEAILQNHPVNNKQEPDGLIKTNSFKDNPYAADFDHHLLKATSSTADEAEESIRSDETPLFAGNLLPKPHKFTRSRSTPGEHIPPLPLHEPRLERLAASDYIATNAEGFLDNTSFCGSNTANSHDLPHPMRSSTGTLPGYKKKHFLPRILREIGALLHPSRMARNCYEILERSLFLWFGFPCLLASWCLFYFLDNPTLSFLPGQASLAWWLLFITRQTVTLGLARLTVYVVVDGFMLGTRFAVQTLGPLLTLVAATGKGWPLILSTWGVYNFVFLHGDNNFQRNWLFWTHIDFFNQHYNGYMLNSSLYTRLLVSAILGGMAVSAKRTLGHLHRWHCGLSVK